MAYPKIDATDPGSQGSRMDWRTRAKQATALSLLGGVGCASVPPLDNPALIQAGPNATENPVLLAPGQPTPEGYEEIYNRVLDTLDDYFEIKPASRYSGVVETLPRIAPGYEQPWKTTTPDARQRLLATFQSMRHYAVARIWAGERGGYRVSIEVYKELEDLQVPLLNTGSLPIFRDSATLDRRSDVISSPRSPEYQWIPAGPAPHRDFAFEQIILRKIQAAGLRP